MKKIILKLILLLLPFHLILTLSLYLFPMKFMDGEYSWYESNREYSLQSDEYNRILIMGDSTAKSSWYPLELSPDTYNFALGGTSPIEEYYYLREYLQNHQKPDYLFYTTGVIHFIEAETLWDRSVYFHRMNKNDVRDLLNKLKDSGDYSAVKGSSSESELLLYEMYSPVKYSTAFLKGLLLPGRYDENVRKKVDVESSRGYTAFGTAEYCNEANYYADYDSFQESKIIDHYFRKIIELCEESGIIFIFQNPPLNEESFNSLNDKFASDYRSYLNGIQKDYPDTVIDMDLYSYDGKYFGDQTHLNEQGAKHFTKQMLDKYTYIFEEPQP